MNLRYFILFIFFFSVHISDVAAKQYSSVQIKHYVNQIPRETEKSLDTLAEYLAHPFDNDYDKAKAAAFWIASRINYDEYLYSNGKLSNIIKHYNGQSPRELINSRVGICSDFANLFKELCRRMKFRAYIISGYVYPVGKSLTPILKRNSRHAWNYFTYNKQKIYVDTTFMASGTTGLKGSQSDSNRRRALNTIKRENKYKSEINNFNEFYFDFSYKEEKDKRKYIRKENNIKRR
ncbi:MAG: transglutaminase-like domain-containing protein [Acetobacter sp.]|nr:transglutaminase-like domain-containing protein [Acetobacter sp.]